MSMFHLGIDVAKVKLDCALRVKDGKIRSKVIANTDEGFTQLQAWLVKQQANDIHICMEATGVYWEDVAQFLPVRSLRSVSLILYRLKPMAHPV